MSAPPADPDAMSSASEVAPAPPPPDVTRHADVMAVLLDRLGIGYFRIEHQSGVLLRASDAFARMFGFPSVQAALGVRVGQHYADPKERDEAAARIYSHPDLASTGVIRFEAQRLRQDTGEPVEVLMSLMPTRRPGGGVEFVDGLMESIGDRKRAETAFRSSEERFRILFDSSVTAMGLASPDGRWVRVNAALCRLVGRGEAEVIGRDVADIVPPADREVVQARLDKQGPSHPGPAAEWRILKPDGEIAWAEVTQSWLGDGDAMHTLVLNLTDVTQRRQLHDAMARIDKLQAVSALAMGIAHDFNDLLTAVLGNVALARVQAEAPTKVRERLELAELAVLRARDLTQQLVTVAHASEPERLPVDLEALLHHTVAHVVREAGRELDPAIEPDLWRAHVDPAEMAQVLQILLQRAVDVGHGGPLRIALANEEVKGSATGPFGHEVAGLQPGRYVRIEVEDRGPHVPSEALTRLFDAYARSDAGLGGLALAMVPAIVQRHGGVVTARSQPGCGCVVTVRVPATELPAPVRQPRPLSGLQGPAGPVRCLVLDDESPAREVAARSLQMLGLEVTTAARADEAVRAYRQALESQVPFDLVLIDLHLGQKDEGLSLLKQLQAVAPGLPVPALVSSGDVTHPVVVDPRAHGFLAAVPKPYTWAQLRAAVAQVARVRQDLQQGEGPEVAQA